MTFLRRPGPRFVLEAVAIILAAAVAGALHLPWWQIGAIVLVVLVASVLLESWLSGPPAQQRPARPPVAPVAVQEPEEPAPHVRVLREYAPPEPEPLPQPAPQPEPPVVVPPPPAPEPEPAAARGPWNLWELERALRESGDTDQERVFLLHYLRDYAGPNGDLPGQFDQLVEESFGHLLGAAR